MRKYKRCPECGAKGGICDCNPEKYYITLSFENGSSYTAHWEGAVDEGIRAFEDKNNEQTVVGIAVVRAF